MFVGGEDGEVRLGGRVSWGEERGVGMGEVCIKVNRWWKWVWGLMRRIFRNVSNRVVVIRDRVVFIW